MPERRTSGKRYGQQLIELLLAEVGEVALNEAEELIRRRRVLDFSVAAGTASARVQLENSPAVKVEVQTKMINDPEWAAAFDALAENSLLLATLLSGEISVEIETALQQAGVVLLPTAVAEIKCLVDDKPIQITDARALAVLQRLADTIDEDPFLLLLLRGRGRDETLLQIRRRRREMQSGRAAGAVQELAANSQRSTVPTGKALQRYFNANAELFALSYTIRADELPAAILKWLDPLPLDGLEDEVEFLFEEAYAQVARRAQAFGLGL